LASGGLAPGSSSGGGGNGNAAAAAAYATCTSGQPVDLHPGSTLFGQRKPPRCVVFAELVITTKPYMRTCTAVDPHWLAEFAPSHFMLEVMAPAAAAEGHVQVREKGAIGPGGRLFRGPGTAPKRPAQRNFMVN
jgi:hypothetical protein